MLILERSHLISIKIRALYLFGYFSYPSLNFRTYVLRVLARILMGISWNCAQSSRIGSSNLLFLVLLAHRSYGGVRLVPNLHS